MWIYLSLAVAIAGGIIFWVADPAKARWVELGKIMLWTGLLAFLLRVPVTIGFPGR